MAQEAGDRLEASSEDDTMARIVFITGTDTGVGKTVLTALLLRSLRINGQRALAVKPFATGSRADARLLNRVQDQALPLEQVNPFFYALSAAPWIAARQAGREVDPRAVLPWIDTVGGRCDWLLVEGCGGLMVPLTRDFFVLDMAAELRAQVILVARNQLGVLNHGLLSLRALRARGLEARAVVLMGVCRPDPTAPTNADALAELVTPAEVVTLPYLGPRAGTLRRISAAAAALEKKLKKTLALVGSPVTFAPRFASDGFAGGSKKVEKNC